MTQYSTRTLAAAIMGDDAVDTNAKAATRTLRKFLRDEMGEGKSVVGKGGRYALDMNKREITAMTKRFKAWEVAQEEAKAARAEALAALKAPKTPTAAIVEGDAQQRTEEEIDLDNEGEVAGPTDDEIAAMLEDDDES